MISLLCPTRGRPDNMRRFAESAWEAAEQPEWVEVVWYVDADDGPSFSEACRIQERGDIPVRVVVAPRSVLSGCWNACAELAAGDILGHMGDDIIFRTPGWDAHVRQAFDHFPDRIAFVHGRDGVHDERLGTHGFVSREWYGALGRMVPPHFSSDWNDVWLTEVADAIGRRVYLPDVLTEHMHYTVGKAERDQTHAEREARGVRDNVAALYASLAGERERDAEKLRGAMCA